jgi:GNAT superfamily N-acetyltransferase
VRVERFGRAHLDDAATLLVETLRMEGDDSGPRYTVSDAASARTLIADAVETGPAVVALGDAALVGFMIAPLPKVPGAGASRMKIVHHAALPPVARDAYRRMYEQIAGDLVAAGCFQHSILVPTEQQAAVTALFELRFGIDQIKGAQIVASGDAAMNAETIRPAGLEDLDRLLELSIELAQFHARPPMLTPALLDVPSIRPVLTDHLKAERDVVLVACQGDAVVGMIQAQPDSQYANTATIGLNIVTKHARSAGVGTTMLHALFAWAADAGFERCAVGWDSANLLSDAFYRSRGFTPLRYELQRSIDPRVAWANENLDYGRRRLR